MPHAAINRRALLSRTAAVAAALALPAGLAGCRADRPAGLTASPDVGVLTGAIAEEEALVGLYEATASSHASLAGRIGPILAHHREHLTVLRRHLRPGTDGRTAAPATPSLTSAGAPSVPASPEAALSVLRAAEHKAAAARVADVERVAPGIAQLLASIGASEAAHAAVLVGAA